MEIFIAIITIVVGVLQIVLFFKLWSMTNDVKKLKNKLRADFDIDRTDEIRIALLKGDKEKAIELLTDKLATELVERCSTDYIDPERITAIKEKYAKQFAKIGVDKLPIIEVNNRNDINGLI